MNDLFRKVATKVSAIVGSPTAFVTSILIIITWALLGPANHYSDTWQLIINTGTTIVTFLMVFLIQNTQNRDAKALHIKLDELIRSIKTARNTMVDIENMSDKDLEVLHNEFQELHRKSHEALEKRQMSQRAKEQSPSTPAQENPSA